MSSISKSGAQATSSKQKVKKPYNIKRSDLNLEEYVQQQDEKSPAILIRRALTHLAYSRQLYAYVAVQLLAMWYGFGQIFFCIGLLWSFYANTGTRKEGEMSAYSIFNEGVQAYVSNHDIAFERFYMEVLLMSRVWCRIEGSTDMAALDQELRSRGFG